METIVVLAVGYLYRTLSKSVKGGGSSCGCGGCSGCSAPERDPQGVTSDSDTR
jgi:hypothetical protein